MIYGFLERDLAECPPHTEFCKNAGAHFLRVLKNYVQIIQSCSEVSFFCSDLITLFLEPEFGQVNFTHRNGKTSSF